MRVAGIAALLLGTLLAGCGSGGAGTASPGATATARVELEVYAAASLKGVLGTAGDAYAAVDPGVTLRVSTDSSAALAAKIEQGAPADLFLAADLATPRRLAGSGLARGDVVAFAGNHLVVIVPAGNPAGIADVTDLARPGVKVVAAAEGVPVTAYAEQLLGNLVAQAAAPASLPRAYTANVVSREDNAAAVVAKVALGEGDAAIVYATDARGRSDIRAIAIPGPVNVAATYGGVVIEGAARPDAAAAFLDWLAADGGQTILEAAGFVPVR